MALIRGGVRHYGSIQVFIHNHFSIYKIYDEAFSNIVLDKVSGSSENLIIKGHIGGNTSNIHYRMVPFTKEIDKGITSNNIYVTVILNETGEMSYNVYCRVYVCMDIIKGSDVAVEGKTFVGIHTSNYNTNDVRGVGSISADKSRTEVGNDSIIYVLDIRSYMKDSPIRILSNSVYNYKEVAGVRWIHFQGIYV